MKRPLKIYGYAWVVLIAATIVTFAVMIIYPSHNELSADPYRIEKIVRVDLPDIASVQSMDNSGGSRWNMFVHKGQFTEEISEESIQIMDDLCLSDSIHWRKNSDEGYYMYFDEGGIDGLYVVSCTIFEDRFVMTYEVEESEGILVILALALAYDILLAWGIILFIISLFRRNPKKS
ncbi:MAG: hypothetical protein IIX08_05300 [Bacteroidales bacterium]|nr:hypothetical protein [Bacteroidales bacterium]